MRSQHQRTPAARHHHNAAHHMEQAAHHHREASRHHGEGNYGEAAHHAQAARGHGVRATEHANEASKHHAAYEGGEMWGGKGRGADEDDEYGGNMGNGRWASDMNEDDEDDMPSPRGRKGPPPHAAKGRGRNGSARSNH